MSASESNATRRTLSEISLNHCAERLSLFLVDASESFAYDSFLVKGQGKASSKDMASSKAADAGYKAMMKNFDK